MGKLKVVARLCVLILIFSAGVFTVSQLTAGTYAAQTLSGDNEVIAINDTTDGLPVNSEIVPYAYSGDGDIILFSSSATNLKDAGYSGSYVYSSFSGLYVYSVRKQLTTRVDISTSGQLPDKTATGLILSNSGRYVIFESGATNLIDGSTIQTNLPLAYQRDVQAGVTGLKGGNSTTNNSNNKDRFLGLSSDARFTLLASRYRGNTYPYSYRIGVQDRLASTSTFYYSVYGENEGGPSPATKGSMSCDGSFVAYQKPGSVEFLDLQRGVQYSIAVISNYSVSPILSCNGRYLLYATTDRTNIAVTPVGMDQYYHLVRYDRVTGERQYIDDDSLGVFSVNVGKFGLPVEPPNIFSASIADTGDVVFNYKGNYYLKHLSDESETLEPIAKKTDGTYVNIPNSSWYDKGVSITSDGRYVFFMADPHALGLASSPSTKQLIRAKTNI